MSAVMRKTLKPCCSVMPGWLDRRRPDGLATPPLGPSTASTRLNSKTRKRSRVRQRKDGTRTGAGLPGPRCRRQATCAGLSALLGRHRTDVGPRHPRNGGMPPLRCARSSRLGQVEQPSGQPRSAYPGRRRRRDHRLAGAVAIHFGRAVDGREDRPDTRRTPTRRAEGARAGRTCSSHADRRTEGATRRHARKLSDPRRCRVRPLDPDVKAAFSNTPAAGDRRYAGRGSRRPRPHGRKLA